MSAELLFELRSEEIPARMQLKAIDEFKAAVATALKDALLDFDTIDGYVTPRRMTVVVRGLPLRQPDQEIEKKGPKVGAPDRAIEGFLGSIGKTLDDCEQRELAKGAFWFYVEKSAGRDTKDVLADLLAAAAKSISWPKSMRWGAHDLKWVRPLQSMICLFDGAVIPVQIGHVTAGNETVGHRILGNGMFSVDNFDDYKAKLHDNGVTLDQHARRVFIETESKALAAAESLALVDDPALLTEVAGLVEHPVPLLAKIDDVFMDVPREILTATMRKDQKYFTLSDANGKMAPRFVVVANQTASDGGAAIVAGNERVLRARLSDARFFWDNDLKKPLEDRLPALGKVTFHAKLGTVLDKAHRLEKLSMLIAGQIEGCDAAEAAKAGLLAKADLVSDVVFEFPEVQGIMGRYLAERQGLSASVANGIASHYAPAGPNDDCPSEPVAAAVAIADKVDTLAGFFGIDEKPTGSKDPFALRRAALGIIRIVLENDLRLPLGPLFDAALELHGLSGADAKADILAFIADRLKVHMKGQGVRHDLIAAVFALEGEDDLARLLKRVQALQTFLDGEDGSNLLAGHKRAANILKKEEDKEKIHFDFDPDISLLQQNVEKKLHECLNNVSLKGKEALENERFEEAMEILAGLRQPIDDFFETVQVNADDAALRKNRLALLGRIRSVMSSVADFAKVDG